ncbi:MAG: hypothetical protein H6721_20135 [Sandaracinus sp.]|nr:hypothetical protein [Myxococcales bacterium]MCB9604407.1 hypothetical protein [Sandaracinus sp.]MCB9617535.1 hypothetical protein [Sandaracinus sp.]MCB9625592.1 hypothetical protein [Sandaracinus sp.]MCB9634438.1 hypothetical protein [Sandaracinus sp.]
MATHQSIDHILATMRGSTCVRAKPGFGTFFTCLFERDGVETSFLWIYGCAWEIRSRPSGALLLDEEGANRSFPQIDTHATEVLAARFEGRHVEAITLRPFRIVWSAGPDDDGTDLDVLPWSRARARDVLFYWYTGPCVHHFYPSGLIGVTSRKPVV